MKTLKHFSVYTALNFMACCAYAGDKLPVGDNGEATYRHSFKLQSNLKDEDVFITAQYWFSQSAGKFVNQNSEFVSSTSKNKALIESAFSNTQPLQSLDPSSGRMAGKGLIKYFGTPGSSIGVLYMEYYVVLEVNNHELTATISKMKYHHYNQRTYVEKPIYGWQGGRPYDSADKLENLVNRSEQNRDLQDVGAYVNKNIAGLLSNLQMYLETQKLLDPSHSSRIVASEN